jgi:hypothetical protein
MKDHTSKIKLPRNTTKMISLIILALAAQIPITITTTTIIGIATKKKITEETEEIEIIMAIDVTIMERKEITMEAEEIIRVEEETITENNVTTMDKDERDVNIVKNKSVNPKIINENNQTPNKMTGIIDESELNKSVL